jgi:transposase
MELRPLPCRATGPFSFGVRSGTVFNQQKNDRRDAQHLLRLLLKDDFPRIWVPTPENRDVRQLMLHRHRFVQMRTRVMNQLQAVAMNEGVRRKRGLWTKQGRAELESLSLPSWTSRRRQELLELLDRFDPRIEGLTQAIEQEAQQHPEVQRLMTHPGVGAITALAFCVGHRHATAVWLRQAGGQLSGIGSLGRLQCRSPSTGSAFFIRH